VVVMTVGVVVRMNVTMRVVVLMRAVGVRVRMPVCFRRSRLRVPFVRRDGSFSLADGPGRARAHGVVSAASCDATRRTTAIAAPNPLSMFTTVTPEAQLESIPNKAVSPPSDTP
jgi:hypothetical protein